MRLRKQVTCLWAFALTLSLAVPTEALHSPVEWYDSTKLDDENGNKVEDILDGIAADPLKSAIPIDAFVCFIDDCRPNSRLTQLGLLAQNGLGYSSTVVASVVVKGVLVQDLIDVVASWPEVGYIHLDHVCEPLMNTAGQALKAHAGFYSPNTVEDYGYDGTGITIAILDTGVDDPNGPGVTHLHLPGAVGGIYFDDSNNLVVGNPDDQQYHGTSVAGCALGRGDANGLNRGIAPGASLFDARIVKSGYWGETSESMIQEAVDWIHDNSATVTPPIKVANISFGSKTESAGSALTASIDALVNSGVVVAVGAGNHNSCTDDGEGNTAGIGMIAVSPRAITVAAASHENDPNRDNDVIANYSRRGPGIGDNPKPDITAYGSQCTSKCPTGCDGSYTISIRAPMGNQTDKYRDFGGTSAASPMVAGAAALLLEKNPSMSPAAVKKLLMNTAEDKGSAGWDATWGAGLMDVGAAVAFEPNNCDLAVVSVDYSPKPVECFKEVTITVTVKNVGTTTLSDFSVDFQRWYFGPNNSPPQRFQLVASPVDNTSGPLAPNATRDFTASWTPGVSDNLPLSRHSCFWGIVNAACDNNGSNNEKNINISIIGVSDQECQNGNGSDSDSMEESSQALSAGAAGAAVEDTPIEFQFRVINDQSEPQLLRVLLENADPVNWFAELDINGVVDPFEVPVVVDNQDCPTWGTLRINRLGVPLFGNFQVVTLDAVGTLVGYMEVMVDLSDRDGDGIADVGDNCPDIPNPLQEDADVDFVGDLCDNCPNRFNPDQDDSDGATNSGFEEGTHSIVYNDPVTGVENLTWVPLGWGFEEDDAGSYANTANDNDPDGNSNVQPNSSYYKSGSNSAKLYAFGDKTGGYEYMENARIVSSEVNSLPQAVTFWVYSQNNQVDGGNVRWGHRLILYMCDANGCSESIQCNIWRDISGSGDAYMHSCTGGQVVSGPGPDSNAIGADGETWYRYTEAWPLDKTEPPFYFKIEAQGHRWESGTYSLTYFWVDDAGFSDTDGNLLAGDSVGNACDNCPAVYNPSQTDSDSDGIGNACDQDCPNLYGVNPVNFKDFSIQAGYWQQAGAGLAGDLNADGFNDIKDLALFAAYWLSDCYEN